MKKILLKNLDNKDILDLVDPGAPYFLIPNFRPNPVSEWWVADMPLASNEKLENVEIRGMSFDLLADLKTVERILNWGRFNQLALLQFDRKVPDTLKTDELPRETVDDILMRNGLVHRIWINYEFVEVSSTKQEYLDKILDQYKDNWV